MKTERVPMQIAVPLNAQERKTLESICGAGRLHKRGEWVRMAIMEKIEREKQS